MHSEVLVYSGGFSPTGGVESFAYDLLDALRSEGLRARLLVWGRRSELLRALENAGTDVVRLPFRWGCRWNAPDWLLLPLAHRALRQARVVVFPKGLPSRIQLRVASWRQPGQTFALVTPYRPAEMYPGPDAAPEVRRETERYLDSFDVILVQAAAFVGDLRQLGYRGRVEVVPLFPPPRPPVRPVPAGPLVVGFVGRLVAQKNLVYLLESFARMSDRRAELHLCGDGEQRSALQEKARQLGVAPRMRLHGRLRREAVGAFIDRCHVVAFSSVSEGQCLAALESLSRGRPVVATPVGAFPEVLARPELGRVVPLGQPEVFARALETVGMGTRTSDPRRVQDIFYEAFSPEHVRARYWTALGLAERTETNR